MMQSTLASTIALGLLRSALMSAGGALLLHGWVTQGELTDSVGALVTFLGVVWQIASSHQKATAVAIVKTVESHPSIQLGVTADGKPVVTAPKLPPIVTPGSQSGLSVTGH